METLVKQRNTASVSTVVPSIVLWGVARWKSLWVSDLLFTECCRKHATYQAIPPICSRPNMLGVYWMEKIGRKITLILLNKCRQTPGCQANHHGFTEWVWVITTLRGGSNIPPTHTVRSLSLRTYCSSFCFNQRSKFWAHCWPRIDYFVWKFFLGFSANPVSLHSP